MSTRRWISIGILLFGVGFGTFLGIMMVVTLKKDESIFKQNESIIWIATVLAFIGLVITSYFTNKKKWRSNDSNR